MGAGSGMTWPLGAPRTAALLCPRITSSSAQQALLGACRSSAHIFGSSPRSAPTGCRLLTENVCPHELRGATVQVLSHTPWSSRVAPWAWDHGSDLTPQIAQCWTQVARLLCLTSAIFQRHLSCSMPFQLQALLGLTDDTPLTEHHLQESSRPYPVSLHCPLHRLLRPPEPTYLWWLRLSLRIPPQPQPVRLPHMGRAHYRPDGTRRRTRGELEARAKKKAKREREAAEAAEAAERAGDRAAAVAAPPEGAEPEEEEKIEVEIEVEEEEAIEELPVRRPLARLRPAPKWGAASDRVPARDRSRSPRRMAISSDRLFRLSKALTSLLRHRAAAEGLPLREDGFCEVGAVTRTRAMRSIGASSAEVLYAVQHDAKRRYTLQYHSGIPWIRAAQGHSQAVRKDLVMRRLRQHELPPFVYHGTRSWCYKSIVRAGLLAGGPSGSRTDIHLVEHFPESGRVLSGWRASCELAIQVDTRRAAAGGCTFFVSDNDVFITEGVDGVLSPAFISAVVILASGEVITSPKAGTAPSGEAVEAGLRRVRRGYMSVLRNALACLDGFGFDVFLPCCFSQVGASLCKWSTRNLAGAAFILSSALRSTVHQPMHWQVSPLRVASVNIHALPTAARASTVYPCHFIHGRIASNLQSAAHWWQLGSVSRTTAPQGAASSCMSSESEDLLSPLPPTAPNGAAEPARGTPLWSPGDDDSEDHPLLSTPSAHGLTTPAGGTPLWSPSDNESEDIMPPSPLPPPPRQAAPRELTQPSQDTSAKGTPIGGLMSRALRRENYAPEILRVVEPVLNQDKSDVTTNHDDPPTTEVRPARPGEANTALTEAPSSTATALPAPDRLPRVNWAENEVFHFNPEAHCLSRVPSASPHPEGMQYGPARQSSRACAKMLVRAGHRCSVCYCLISLCSCHHGKLNSISCSGHGSHAAHSHPEPAHASSCVSQAADLLFSIRLEPLSISYTQLPVCRPHPLPHGWQHPHPHQWQVLHRSYTRKQRRAHKHRSLPPAAAQSVFHAVFDWLHACSPLAIMNPHRPGGGPRQHYRPDGSRRRTAGELAKRAAKAAARAAAAAADAAGGGVAQPAGPAVAKDGASTGTPAQATTSVTTAPLGVPPASTSTPASSTADASTSAPKSEPAPAAYPSRVQHPPPSIAAGPKPGGGEHRTWLPALPALRVKAPPPHLQAEVTETAPGAPEKAPSPKRTAEAATLAPDETGDPKMSTAEQKQALIPTAPSGEPPRLGPSQLPPEPPPPRRSKRSRTQPPRQLPAADYAQTKWSQVTTLENMLEDIREAEVATMLSLFQQAGHYTSQHGPFHDLRDSLMRDQVCGPNGEPLPLPPVGNWILALGISLLGYDTPAGRELLTRLTNPQTVGDLTEAWAFQLWNRGHQSLCTQLSGFFMLLHNLLEDVPSRVYSVLGQEWRLTWMEFRAVVRAWIGDPPTRTMLAITQVPETETAHGRFGRLSETMRARSLSPGHGPLLGSRASFLDNTMDANAIPTILLPYTFPAFQVGSALPLSLQDQDQSECAYMFAWMTMQVWLLAAFSIFTLLRCLRRCWANLAHHCLWCHTQCFDLRCLYPGVLRPALSASLPGGCSRPSRVLCRRLVFLLCMSCFIWPGYSTGTAFATGTADPTVASDLPVHHPLTLPAADCQSLTSAGPTHLPRKRALRRAIGRAARHPAQTTHYKGRLCTLAALREAPTTSGARPALRSRRGDTDSKQGPRLTALSWNVGGLSQEAWLEVQIWMHEQTEHDVILLQETHWRFTSSWSLPRYHIFHSGATDHRFQGCMIAIRKSIASFESVRWSTPLVGHLMHVRFPVQGRHVDIINLYQYALSTGPDRAAVLHKRERVLHHLDKTLSSLPIRNVLLLGGDFNTMGTRDSLPFGPGTYLGPHPHPDRHLLAHLANTHRLTALNTWGRVSKAPTFEHDQTRSQIDFFFARAAQIDGRSRRACTDPLFHLLRWRGGARHYPVLVNIPAVHYQSPAKLPEDTKTHAPRYQLDQPPDKVQAFCAHLAHTLSASPTPSDLDRALQQAAAQHLIPAQPTTKSDSAADRVTGVVKHMWNLRHTAQQFAIEVLRPFTLVAQIRHWRGTGERLWFSLGQLFSAWRHQASYLRQHRYLRRRGRQVKKELLEEQLQQAWEADQQGDKSSIWKVVNRLAPRTARIKIQLRGKQGNLLTPTEEADRFRTYCEHIYKLPTTSPSTTTIQPSSALTPPPRTAPTLTSSSVHSPHSPHPLPRDTFPPHSPPSIPTLGPLEVPHLAEALSLLPARKATPPHLAQLSLWHLGKDVLLPHLAVLCRQLWQSPHAFHQLWADAWIAWLAKPGKAPDQPENLRPISLTEGGGRIVVKALTLQLRPSLTEATQSWPQYAYVPGRSIEHAIIRALHHCDRVNTAIASQRVTLRERRATGRIPTACSGGVTLSIDTSKAFDTVDRGVLERELKTARVPEPELTLILSLHRNIGYWPAGPTSDVRVSSERGVRQGCPLAPSLWTLVTVALLRTMADTESLHWIQHNATVFADDLLLQWEYHSVSELERMVSAIQHCFQVLARLGLQVQHRKTQLLVAQKGRLAHKWWKAHTASTKEGRFLRIPQPNHKDLHLPIVPQLTYLGIVLSYVDAATATVEHRLQVAEAQRARLLKVLHSRTLPLHKRVQLWLACVRSSALYGLHLLDLKQKHVARITIVLVRHLRAIARSFAHMSQEASQALLLRLDVEDPLSFLLRASQKLLAKTLHSQDPMVHQPCILQWLTRITESRLALDSHVVHVFPPGEDSGPAASVPDEEVRESLRIASLPPPLVGAQPGALVSGRHGPRQTVFSCPTCRLYFPDLATLKKHHAKHHASPIAPPHPTANAAEVRQHSVDGMPVCRHCSKDYVTWFNLKRHIQHGHCTTRWQATMTPQTPHTSTRTELSHDPAQSQPEATQTTEVPPTAAALATAPVSGVPTQAGMSPPSPPLDGALIPVSPAQWLSFARLPEVQTKLRQFCVTCGQWLVSVKSIKLHYRHVHVDIYNRFCQAAAADCKKVGHIVSPCVYCGAHITRTDQHSGTCPVLWQARVCCLVQAARTSSQITRPAQFLGSASSDPPSIPPSIHPSVPSSDHDSRDRTDGAGCRGIGLLWQSTGEKAPGTRHGGATGQISPPERERQPATEEQPAATTATAEKLPPNGPLSGEPSSGRTSRKIGDFFGPVTAQSGKGAHRPVGLPVPPSERPHRPFHFSEWRRPSVDGAATPRGDGQLAGPAQQGQGHQIPQADSAPVCDVGNHNQSFHVCGGQDCSGQGSGDGMGHQRSGVQLPRLERRGATTRPSPRGDANTGSGVDRRQKAQNTLERAGTHHQVRCSPQCPTELGLGNSDVRLRAIATNPGGSGGHGDLSEVVCLLRPSASVTPAQTGPPRAVAVDQGASGGGGLVIGRGLTFSCVPAIPRSLVTVTLHNPGNHCYLNSTVYLLAYACCMHAPHGPPRGATALEYAVHSVLANPGEDTPPGGRRIAELPAWRSLLVHWHGLHQQQDAMELLHHLLERNPLPFANCQWEARPIPGTEAASRPLIRGSIYVSVPLPRRGHATLQDCVVQWHEQKIPHGLLGTPSFLLVNLARYANIARGKNPIRLPCKAMQKVSFPVFRGTGHDVAWTSYTLVAGIMHLGPQPQSGHYRSFLAHPGSCLDSWPQVSTSCSSEPQLMPAGDRGSSAPSGRPSAPSGSRHYTWWCTDDGKAAEVCHPTYYRTLSENCYVLCFCLTEHLNTC